jgi:hypothetical protein
MDVISRVSSLGTWTRSRSTSHSRLTAYLLISPVELNIYVKQSSSHGMIHQRPVHSSINTAIICKAKSEQKKMTIEV